MGVLWTNNCPRAVADVDRPDLLEGREGDAAYRAAERALQVRVDQFDESRRAARIATALGASLAVEGRRLRRLPLAGTRQGATQVDYVGPADILAGSPRVQTRTGTADRVELIGGRVGAVVVDGVALAADEVVLAGGAIETPHLLWRSGVRPAALGTHLSYHPVLFGQVVLQEPGRDEPGGDGLVRAGGGGSEVRGRARVADRPGPDPPPRLCIPPTSRHPWFTMLLRDTNPLPVDDGDVDVPPDDLVEIQVFAPVDPHPDNRLDFTTGTPCFDVPLRAADERRRRRIERDAAGLVRRLGRARRGCHPQWAPLGTPHLMGSCRMGTDADTSVVDPTGRVRGVDNLWLATTGVIPTRLAVNPTLTAAALAVRTTDHLLARAATR